MKRWSIALLLMAGCDDGVCAAAGAGNSVHRGRRLPQAAGRPELGEDAGVAVNSKGTSSCSTRGNNDRPGIRRARRRSCSSSTRTASSSARSARTSMPGRSRHTVARRSATTTSGPSTRARTWSSSSTPDGQRRRWCSAARRKRRTRDRSRWTQPDAAAAARRRQLPPADRRDLGSARATSSSATATSIRASPKYDKNGDWVKSWGEPGHQARRVRHAAQHRGRRAAATSTSPTAATAASRSSTATASTCARSGHRRAGSGRCPAGDRQHARPPRPPGTMQPRRAVGRLHHAGPEPGAVHRQTRIRAGSTS